MTIKNKKITFPLVWKILQPVLISVITFCSIGVLKSAVEIHDFMISTKLKDESQDRDISNFRIDIGINNAANNRQDGDIQTIFAILPQSKTKSTKIK